MTIRILHGDCRAILPTLDAESFDCCVTSPPYWGLRSYLPDGHEDKHREIGLEPTMQGYLETMVGVCREVKRVLKPGATFWLNVGDAYTGGSKGSLNAPQPKGSARSPQQWAVPRKGTPDGLKQKDLCMIPNRLAIMLQSDGWYVRSEIIWHKVNPMPESVTDRPTCAHEKVWLLTKGPKYFYDAAAISEGCTGASGAEGRRVVRVATPKNLAMGLSPTRKYDHELEGNRNARNVWQIASQPYAGAHFATMPRDLAERCIKAGCPAGGSVLDPFGGAGTTGLVADRLGRNATLIELNPSYRDMGAARIQNDAPLFAKVAAE